MLRRFFALLSALLLALNLVSGPVLGQAYATSPTGDGKGAVTSVTGQTGAVQLPTVCSPVTAGNTVAATAVETAFTNTCVIPANTIRAGTSVLLRVGGIYSAATADSAVGKVYYTNNSAIAPGSDTVLLNTGTLNGIAGVSGKMWWGEISITFYSTTSMDVQGLLFFAAATNVWVPISNSSTFTIDPTKNLTIYLTVDWSSNSASDSMTLRAMNMK